MKKIALALVTVMALVIMSSMAFADDNEIYIRGQVAAINISAATIDVKDNQKTHKITVDPDTDFEVKVTGQRDRDIFFSDLKVGDKVRVECKVMNDGTLIADEVKVLK